MSSGNKKKPCIIAFCWTVITDRVKHSFKFIIRIRYDNVEKEARRKKNHTVQLTQLHKLYYCSASAYDDQHSHGYPSLINNEKNDHVQKDKRKHTNRHRRKSK